jgi:hypothetical protein
MYRGILALLIAFGLAGTASAQTLKFDAEIAPDGQLELVPSDQMSRPDVQSEDITPNPMTEENPPEKLYLWKDSAGDVKGVFSSEQLPVQQLGAGESIQAFDASSDIVNTSAGVMGVSAEQMQQLAKDAAQLLLQAAKDSACAFEPKPETVSPSVQISFSFFAGASFQISAQWRISELCP